MEHIQFITSPIIGAVIGYFTNWLAIKMLFRPYEEKRILGIKLPFTPGLVPKERLNLSKKIAATVSEHLLTKEVLTDAFTSEEVLLNISNVIIKFTEDIKDANYNISDILEFLLKKNKNIYTEKAEIYILDILEKELFSEEMVEQITEYSLKYLVQLSKSEKVFLNEAFLKIKDMIVDLTKEYFESEQTKESLKAKIHLYYEQFLEKDQQLKELVPQSLILKMIEIVENKIGLLPEFIKTTLEENAQIDEGLRKLTEKIIEDNFGRFVGVFINHNKVYENIKNGLIQYLSEKENQEQLILKAVEKINEFLENKVDVIDSKITDEMKQTFVDKIYYYIENNLNVIEDASKYFLEKIKSKNENLDIISLIIKIKPDFLEKTKVFIKYKINTSIKIEFLKIANDFVKKYKTKLFDLKLNTIISFINKENENTLNENILKVLMYLVDKGSIYIVSSLNIGKIVEERINSFSVKEAEEIVVSVVNKELNLITVLGGILGFVIGLLPPIINSF